MYLIGFSLLNSYGLTGSRFTLCLNKLRVGRTNETVPEVGGQQALEDRDPKRREMRAQLP